MSTYSIIKLNWDPNTKITTLIVSPANNLSITYTAQMAHANQTCFDMLFEIMQEWDPVPWTVDDVSSKIRFIGNKHNPINVTKKVTDKKKKFGTNNMYYMSSAF